jgi:hypothetical protein
MLVRSERLLFVAVFLVVACLSACSGGSSRSSLYAPGGPVSMLDFIQTYNAYALGQVYFQNSRYPEAIVEYERSLERYSHLNALARASLREQYGVSQELIEGELTLARAMVREQKTPREAPTAEATQPGK